MKNVYPRNLNEIRAALFDKLNSFGFTYTSEEDIIKNVAVFDFESMCFQAETFKNTNTTWLVYHVPLSASIFSNHVEGPIFLASSDPHHVVAALIGALESLASQSKAEKNLVP